jgi:hypothetical protein
VLLCCSSLGKKDDVELLSAPPARSIYYLISSFPVLCTPSWLSATFRSTARSLSSQVVDLVSTTRLTSRLEADVASGINLAFVELIYHKDARVLIADLRLTPEAEKLVQSSSGKVAFVTCDVEALPSEVTKAFGEDAVADVW